MAKIIVKCDTCNKEFEKYKSKIGKNNFCCRECYLKFHSKDVHNYICETCGKEFKGDKYNANRFCCKDCYNQYHNIKNKIRICPCCKKSFTARTSNSKYCSQECHLKMLHESIKGENHPNWNGGISILNDRHDSLDYKKWRQEVYKRDNYQCQICGSKNKINAHHIYSWKFYPEKRYDINNGITLCEECHTKIHKKFGYHSKEKMI